MENSRSFSVKLNGYVEEMYNGQSVVQTFNYQERDEKMKFSQLNDAH